MAEAKLIFVYNVDASPVALLRDLYQGLTTGSTDCHLCDITFGKLLKDRSWAAFVKELPVACEFRLRSTFLRKHPNFSGHAFPAVFLAEDDEKPNEFISAANLNAVDCLEALRSLVSERVSELNLATQETGPLASNV